MKLTYREILSVAVLAIVVGVISLLMNNPFKALGSVPAGGGNAYLSTTTPGVLDLINLCPARIGVASSTTGVLGSVVVTGPNVGNLQIYDATTTDNTKRVSAATSSLLLADIPSVVTGNATSSATTYTFDVEFKRGLVVDKVGVAPTTTITYRCEG